MTNDSAAKSLCLVAACSANYRAALMPFHKTDLDFSGGVRQGLERSGAPGSVYKALLWLGLTGR